MGLTSKFKGRSVSLTRNDAKKKSPPRKVSSPSKKISSPSKRKRKTPPKSSPVSVKERKSRFEQSVQDKYRERCQKISREKIKTKRELKSKANQDDDENSVASLLKKISADICTMKSDLKENNQKIDSINDKIQDLENNAEKTAKSNKLQFELINGKVARLETNITDKVIEKLDPQIKTLKNDLKKDLKDDLTSLVDEQLAKRFPEKVIPEENGDKTEPTAQNNVSPTEVQRMIDEAVSKIVPPASNENDANSSESAEDEAETEEVPEKRKKKKK